MSSAGFMA